MRAMSERRDATCWTMGDTVSMGTGETPQDIIVIVDDSPEDRATYKRFLTASRVHRYSFFEAETLRDGIKLCQETSPRCVLLDVHLPDGTGIEFLDQLARAFPPNMFATLVMTGLGSEELAVEALQRGATDYLPKRRINGESLCRSTHRAIERNDLMRMLRQEQDEKDRLIDELRDALAQVKRLSGLLPICASCKKVRDDKGYWHQVEIYIRERTDAEFSHGVCPDCAERMYGDLWREVRDKPEPQAG